MDLRRSVLLSLIGAVVAFGFPAAAHAGIFEVHSGLVIGAPDGTHMGRAQPQQPGSTCLQAKAYPGTLDGASAFHYDSFAATNKLNETVCVTVSVNTSCASTHAVFSTTYSPSFNPADLSSNYLADMGAVTPTASSYSFLLQPGASFETVVDEASSGAGCSSLDLQFDSDLPWAYSLPVVQGNPAVGSVLTGEDGGWAGAPTFTRQWRRCDASGAQCADIPGATAATYTVGADDFGHTLRLRVDATEGTTSSVTSPATNVVFIPFEAHSESLTAADAKQTGSLALNGVAGQCGAPKANPGLSSTSGARAYDLFPVTNPLVETACVTVRVAPQSTCSLKAATYLSFDPALPANGYLTDAGGTAVSAQPAQYSFPLAPGQSAVNVISANGAGATCNSYAVTLGADRPWPTTVPALTGAAVEGQALTAGDGVWSGSPTLARAWLRCDSSGGSCAPIAAATGASYTPVADDVGHRLRVVTTATGSGSSGSVRSPASDLVAAAPVQKPGGGDGGGGGGGSPGGGGGGGGTPSPPVDRTPPGAKAVIGTGDLAAYVRKGTIPVTVTCDEDCRITLEIDVSSKVAARLGLGKTVKIASGAGTGKAGARTTVKLKLTRKARQKLKHARSLKVALKGGAVDAAGNSRRLSAKATLKAR